MATKPTVKPRWATDDVTDPGSGTDNVAEPAETKKDRGWDDQEIPPRQWWNWLWRIAYRWIDWLDGTTIPLTSTDVTANEQKADGTGHTHEITGFFRTSQLFQEIEDAGTEAQDEAVENLGLRVSSISVELGNTFTAGQTIKLSRTGNQISCAAESDLAVTHTSDDSATSTIGVIPPEYRPTHPTIKVYFIGSSAMAMVSVFSNGTLVLTYRDYSGAGFVSSDSLVSFEITYGA